MKTRLQVLTQNKKTPPRIGINDNYPVLASDTLIGSDEPVSMVHHDSVMFFALGVVAKCN